MVKPSITEEVFPSGAYLPSEFPTGLDLGDCPSYLKEILVDSFVPETVRPMLNDRIKFALIGVSRNSAWHVGLCALGVAGGGYGHLMLSGP